MPVGRPTKYSDETLAKTKEYLDGGYKSNGKVIPSRQGLARHLGIATSTLDAWEKDPEKVTFSGMLEQLRQDQHDILINNGLTGDFNATIAKLALTKHGYTDKVDSNVNLGSMSDEALDARIRSLLG